MKVAIVCTIVVVMIGVVLSPCFAYSPDFEEVFEPFDHDTGLAILQDTEKCILTLIYSDSLHQFSNIDAARKVLYDSYGDKVLFDSYADKPDGLLNLFFNFETQKYVESGFFFPTIFHKDMELTDAYVRTPNVTDQCPFRYNVSTFVELRLVEKYTGNDQKIKGFGRETVYKLTDSGQWEIARLDMMNYCADPALNFTYLDLKDGVEVDVID